MNPPDCRETNKPQNAARDLRRRLDALVGESEAQELWEAPHVALQGRSPDDMVSAGYILPVEIMVRDMETREASRRDFIKRPHREVDEIDHEVAADPILDRIPQQRNSRGTGRIFAILDQLEQGGSK